MPSKNSVSFERPSSRHGQKLASGRAVRTGEAPSVAVSAGCVMVLLAFAGCSNAPEAAGTGGDGGTGGGTGGTTGHAGVTSATSGSGGAGGAPGAQAGGAAQTGGTTTGGRANSTGGAATAGGSNGGHATMSSGGASPLAGGGGQPASGGRSASGGAGALGGAGGRAGGSSRGGAGAGGAGAAGGAAGKGGSAGGAGTGGAGGEGPCDIYAAANTPCVAAHSTARALYAAYAGPLYQVRRASDKTTKDVPATGPGGVADMTVQDAFCNGTSCTISILYDQTTNKNDLLKSPVAHWLDNGGTESSATKGKTTLNGHTVYGIYVTGYSDNVAYRNNSTKGVAKGDAAEAMYMVVDGKRFSDQCCFDYGNAETSGNDDGNGTMEAVYFGNDITWGGKGEGNGPWVAGDLENGVFKSDKGGWQSQSLSVPSAKSIVANFATAMLKGPSGNHFTLKGGSAQSGTLTTMWDGVRPSSGYSPKKLQGAIILGTGGDGSNGGTGTFYEGAMTSGNPSDAVDDAIQANIVAAGYGR